MSTRAGLTLAAMPEMSEGAPAPVEEFPLAPDDPDPNGELPFPVEPEPPPGLVMLGAADEVGAAVHTTCPTPAPVPSAGGVGGPGAPLGSRGRPRGAGGRCRGPDGRDGWGGRGSRLGGSVGAGGRSGGRGGGERQGASRLPPIGGMGVPVGVT